MGPGRVFLGEKGIQGEEEVSKRGGRAGVLSTGFAIWGELNPFMIFGVSLFSC